MSVTAERVVLWLTETSCHFMCVNLFFFSQFCLQTRSLAFLIEFFVGNIDDTFHYQFGQHSIGCGQVFYKTALSFAFVNIKPVLPGRILKKIKIKIKISYRAYSLPPVPVSIISKVWLKLIQVKWLEISCLKIKWFILHHQMFIS